MIRRRLCSLVALGVLMLSSGCCWHHRCCCHHPVFFPRIREAYWERRGGCCEPACTSCCHADEFVGPPIAATPEPTMASLPMPRTVPMKPVN